MTRFARGSPTTVRRSLLLCLAVLTGALAVPAQAQLRTLDQRPRWSGTPTGVFRTATLDHGELIWTNGIWQALGANADHLHRTDYFAAADPVGDTPTHIPRDVYNAFTYDFFGSHRLTHNGDAQLPANPTRWPDGTGEVAEIRLTGTSTDLYIRLRWNSMPSAYAQLATFTFATAAAGPRPSSALTEWPHNAHLKSHYQTAVTISGAGVSLGDGPPSTVNLSVDVSAHLTTVRIPRRLLPPGPWRLGGGSGLADPAHPDSYWTLAPGPATTTTPGSGGPTSPSNVLGLFFSTDSPWTFDELAQADQLATGTSTSVLTVDPKDLQLGIHGPTRVAPLVHGDLSRLFRSRYSGGDGISKDRQGLAPAALPGQNSPPVQTSGFDETWHYTGDLQTYDMHVPGSYTGASPRPLVVYLHGYTGLAEEPFHNPVGLVPEIDRRGWLLASALGRGDYYYRGPGDLDVMEMIADVEAHYNVDPNRIYLMGHSMGGYGTDNVATHHPDVFAAVAPAEGTDSVDLSPNLRNTPWFMMTADEDLDTLARNALAQYALLSQLGYQASLIEYRLKIHEYSSIYDTLPRLFAFFSSHVRTLNPAVVTYVQRPHDELPALGLRYDGAYWVSGMVAANPQQVASVTAESLGIAHRTADPSQATRRDYPTDDPGPTGRTLAQFKQTTPAPGNTVALSRRLRLTALNLARITLDLGRAGFELAGGPVRIQVTTDVPIQITADGHTYRVAAGNHTLVVGG